MPSSFVKVTEIHGCKIVKHILKAQITMGDITLRPDMVQD